LWMTLLTAPWVVIAILTWARTDGVVLADDVAGSSGWKQPEISGNRNANSATTEPTDDAIQP
jgi:hypothetical protein